MFYVFVINLYGDKEWFGENVWKRGELLVRL